MVMFPINRAKECCYNTTKSSHCLKNETHCLKNETYCFCKSLVEYLNDIACKYCINLGDFKKLAKQRLTSGQLFTKLVWGSFLFQGGDFVYDLDLKDIFHTGGFS